MGRRPLAARLPARARGGPPPAPRAGGRAGLSSYVRDYFDRHAHEWLEGAYAEGDVPAAYPVGQERLRLALGAIEEKVPPGGKLVDLGCGGGQLCALAGRLGYRVTGVDIAPAMIAEAEGLKARLPAGDAERVSLVCAPFDDLSLPESSFDAVTAMGLIEYLPDDAAFFEPAHRLLRPGGRVAVSCRNRLYNLQSANEYTLGEIEAGTAPALVRELSAGLREPVREELAALARELAARSERLRRAAELDAGEPPPELLDHPRAFGRERRQHTPAELERSAGEAGFESAAVLALHPHPFAPVLERSSPRVYNQLALAWQRALERSPAGLATSTAFVAVFDVAA